MYSCRGYTLLFYVVEPAFLIDHGRKFLRGDHTHTRNKVSECLMRHELPV
jgi:hypothetical protein